MPVHEMDQSQRVNLAKELGYRTIGKELPDSVTLTQVIKSLPEEVRLTHARLLQGQK
jgi:omega-6 fatty acid desaturase (delta-12 desaturase)